MKKRPFPLHPLLFGLFPIASLLAANIQVTAPDEAARATLASLAVVGVLWGAIWLILRVGRRAGVAASLGIILFFSYGHGYALLVKRMGEPSVQLDSALLWVWGIVFGIGLWWAGKRLQKVDELTFALNWMAVAALALPLYTIGAHTLKSQRVEDEAQDVQAPAQTALLPLPTGETPDVYYIILDGYGRADTLAEYYDFDNSELMEFLSQRGFYIAEASYSNYNQTFLSLPSSLNMEHIVPLMGVEPGDKVDYDAHIALIRDSEIARIFKRLGYETVTYNTGFVLTTVTVSDHYMTGARSNEPHETTWLHVFGYKTGLRPIEVLLLESTVLRPALESLIEREGEPPGHQAHRDNVLYTFEHLADFAGAPGNYFVFAHVIAPHPPFLFAADGSPVPNARKYSLADASHFLGRYGTRGEYIRGYREQAQYINTLLMQAIDEILANSETPPIIIVQGDHGGGAYFEWESLAHTQLEERYAILNAYYFPGGDCKGAPPLSLGVCSANSTLYPTITPVNSFRTVLNRYFGFDIPLLEDTVWWSNWSTPYDFTEVTERLEGR